MLGSSRSLKWIAALAFLNTLSTFAMAQRPLNGAPIATPAPASQPSHAAPTLPWFSVTEDEAKRAHCKTAAPPTSEAISQYLDQASQDKRISAEVNGYAFRSESSTLLEGFRKLTTTFDIYDHVNPAAPETQIDLGATYPQSKSCETVLCATDAIWGHELGIRLLYLIIKYNLNASEFAFADVIKKAPDYKEIDKVYRYTDRFYLEELDPIFVALGDFPAPMTQFSENHPLIRYRRGQCKYNDPNCKVEANAEIYLFDPWGALDPATQTLRVFHEFSHDLAFRNTRLGEKFRDETEEWLSAGQWIKTGAGITSNWKTSLPMDQSSSRYARTNPTEDFAESSVLYRYAPERLKEIAPAKYNYIRDSIMHGIEFTSEETCSNLRNYSVASTQSDSPAQPAPALIPTPSNAHGPSLAHRHRHRHSHKKRVKRRSH